MNIFYNVSTQTNDRQKFLLQVPPDTWCVSIRKRKEGSVMQLYLRTSANLVLSIFFESLFMNNEMYYLIRNRGRRGSVMQLDLRTSANLVKLIVAKLCFPSSLHQCSDATISIRLAANILPDYFNAANILPDYFSSKLCHLFSGLDCFLFRQLLLVNSTIFRKK